MSDEVRKVYEKYQHLDALLSNELYMSDNNFSGKLMRDLWLAIKQQSHPAPPPQVVRGEGYSLAEASQKASEILLQAEQRRRDEAAPQGDNFRNDAVALARLVLSTDAVERALYSAQGETVRENLIEIRRLANLLVPKDPLIP